MKKPKDNWILHHYLKTNHLPSNLSGALGIIAWYMWSSHGVPVEVFMEMINEEPDKYYTIARNMSAEALAYIHEMRQNAKT